MCMEHMILAEFGPYNSGIPSKIWDLALTKEGLTLLGKVEKNLFIESFTECGMSEQVCQQFLCSQE